MGRGRGRRVNLPDAMSPLSIDEEEWDEDDFEEEDWGQEEDED